MSLKNTLFAISLSFSLAFTIFFVIFSMLPDHTYAQHEKFYSQELPGKKIFLFGSSQIYAINPEIVSDVLNESGFNYTVFHLGQGASDTEELIRTSDLIISQKPDVVIYGVAYHTFYSHGRTIVEKPSDSVIHPPRIQDLLSSLSLPTNNGLLDNPKFAIINTINHFYRIQFMDIEEPSTPAYLNTPFFNYDPNQIQPVDPSEFEIGSTLINYKGNEIYPINKNRTFDSLKQFIHKLQENEIEVIIFTTPHNKNWLSQVPIQQKEIFDSMLINLETEFNFKVYRLHDKVSSMSVWKDHDHLVAHNPETDFYSEEIAKIILVRIDEI